MRSLPDITVKLARTFEDMAQVLAIRSAVYIGEECCPYDEEFDGNDFCAAHLVALSGREPVGTLRIRFFAGFIKIERLAVRPDRRGEGAARALAAFSLDYAACKGFRRAVAHARHDRVSFWSQFGFALDRRSRSFDFSDYSYVDVWADIAAARSAPQLADPYVLIRPEGEWGEPGPLERSSSRVSRSVPMGGLDAAA